MSAVNLDLLVFGRAAGNHIVGSKLAGQAHRLARAPCTAMHRHLRAATEAHLPRAVAAHCAKDNAAAATCAANRAQIDALYSSAQSTSDKPPVHLNPNMDTQEKGKPFRRDTSGLFNDDGRGRSRVTEAGEQTQSGD